MEGKKKGGVGMKCIRCGKETSNGNTICETCRNAEEAFRRRVRLESEEHAREVRMEQERHRSITWKEKIGLYSTRGKLMMGVLIISGIAIAISLLFSFLLSLLLGDALSNLMAVNRMEGTSYINGFAMLKMAYLNNLKLSIQFTALGVSGQATAIGSISVLILVLIPFLSFKMAWMIFKKWIWKEKLEGRTIAILIAGILILFTFVFALTSFVPVWWKRGEGIGTKWDTRMYFTLASSIIGTFSVVLASNILAVRKKNTEKKVQGATSLYFDVRSFLRIGVSYLCLALVITVVGIILFLSSQAKDWTSVTGTVCLLPNLTAASAGIITGGGYTIMIQGKEVSGVSAYFPGGIIGMVIAFVLTLTPILAVMVIQYRKLRERMGQRYYLHVGIVTGMLVLLQVVIWKLGYVGIDVVVPSIFYHLLPVEVPLGVEMGSSPWMMVLVMIILSTIGVFLEKQAKNREEMKILFDTLEKYDKIVISVVPVAIFIVMLILGLFL